MSSQGEQELFSIKRLDNLHSKIIEILIDNIPDYVYIKDKELKFLKINPKTAKALGLKSPAEAIGKSDFDFFPEIAEKLKQDELEIMRSGKQQINEPIKLKFPDRTIHWVSVTKIPFYDENGEVLGITGISKEITDWMDLNKKISNNNVNLKERNIFLKNILDTSPNLIFVKDYKGKYLIANKAIANLYQTTPEDMIGKSDMDYVDKSTMKYKEAKFFMDIDLAVIRTKKKKIIQSEPFTWKDGTTHYFHTIKIPISFKNNPDCLLGISVDITELKKTEFKYETILETSVDGFWINDINGNFLEVNNAFCKMIGYTRDELLKMNIRDIEALESNKKIKRHINTVLKAQADSFESKHKCKDGKILDVLITCNFFDREKKLFANFIKNISASKEIQDSLRFHSLTLNQIQDRVVVTDLKGNITYVNDAICKMLKRKRDELIGKSINIFGENPNNGVPQEKILVETLKNGVWRGEVVNYNADGEPVILECRTQIVKDNNGKAIALCGISTDVTERKTAEKKLIEREELFRTIVHTAPSVLLILDKKGKVTYISPNVNELTGHHPKEYIGNKMWWVHPDDNIKAKMILEKTFKDHTSRTNFEYKSANKNGDIWYASSSWEPIYDQNGDFNGIVMQTIDITERKKREIELKKGLLKYDLNDGYLYLQFEKTPTKSINAFKDLLNVGYNGHIITRTPINHFKDSIKNKVDYYWLSEEKTNNSINPNFKSIIKKVESLNINQTIFIDRLDYLLTNIGFDRVLKLLQRLNEIAYVKNHIIILSMDPDVINKQQLSLIKKDVVEIEPRKKIPLEDDLKEMIEYIYSKNINSIRPSYSEIDQRFRISKPTARNKIKKLKQKGFVTEKLIGRKKVLEITDKTKNMFY